jgi:hypothetical protein
MKNENYIQIQGWMINDLGLRGNELILYAIIFGFSQDGESQYFGSQRYISRAMKVSLPTVNKVINKLLDKKFIIQVSESRYQANFKVLKKVKHGVKESLTLGVKESLTNNIYTNNNTNCEASSQDVSPLKAEALFDNNNYIKEMLSNPRRHIQLIGKYFITRKSKFPSKVAIEAETKRWLRDSRVISEYPDEKINQTFALVVKKFPEEWNLSTIRKYINN